jgi:exopolyphosphatase/guanosine-5'-triphosphate,3'-diphosphate pyrophosphatase
VPAPAAPDEGGPVAVIDIGSNSLRLVVYDGVKRAPLPLLNEKVLCGLGRDLSASSRLNPEGVVLALRNLERFVALARTAKADNLHVLATAAVRDADDGADFVNAVERACNVRVRILGGDAEGRLSALGVLAGIPDADGLVGDLGGGSVELVPIARGRPGAAATLPLGPLRLAHLAESEKKLREAVDGALATVPQSLAAGKGGNLYLVGGAWRALARIHMEHSGYPLHIIHRYELSRGDADNFLQLLGKQSKKSLERLAGVSKKRLEAVPLAALVLLRLIRAVEPKRLVFSAFGLREGLVFDLLSDAARQEDPLLAAAAEVGAVRPRFGMSADELLAWTASIFPKQGRLHRAIALLSDTAWSEHPDYRAEEAFLRALRFPVGGYDHRERGFVATALHARYGGDGDAALLAPVRRLLSGDRVQEARAFGLALRLAYTMTGGAPGLLSHTALTGTGGTVTLTVPDEAALFVGDTVQRRLDALGRVLGRRSQLTQGRKRQAARA